MKPARVSLLLSTVALLAAAILPAVGRGQERPVNVVMGDQFNNRVETAQLRGDVVVLVYAGRHGAEAAMELGRTLHTRFHPTAEGAEPNAWSTQPVVGLAGWPAGLPVPDVKVIPVACVPEVPKALHGMVRRRLKQESPVVPVWLDFEDVMRPSFGMVPDEPNVLLIDTRGMAQGVVSGHLDQRKLDEVAALIDDLRKQALPDVRTASFPAPVRQ
jgi:predicted transcriptional regulator